MLSAYLCPTPISLIFAQNVRYGAAQTTLFLLLIVHMCAFGERTIHRKNMRQDQ